MFTFKAAENVTTVSLNEPVEQAFQFLFLLMTFLSSLFPLLSLLRNQVTNRKPNLSQTKF